MEQKDIVQLALENLEKNTGITGEWRRAARPGADGDGTVDLVFQNEHTTYFVEVKKQVRNHQLPQIEDLAARHKNLLVVAEQIFPKIKEELRQKNIAYLETNGNIYARHNRQYLWIDGLKPLQAEKETGNRAFTKTGLKVVYHFLIKEEFVNYPYREIAAMAGVGLGNVNNVMNGLKDAGFLLRLNKSEYKLVNKKELLEKWMVAYEEKLKPALLIGTFRFLKEEEFKNWKQISLPNGHTYWGGEPAADKLMSYLRPEILTIYTTESRTDLIKHYRLIPDTHGDVSVYKRFWNYDEYDWDVTDPILVYVDLMNTGDGRCIDAAKRIYDAFLQIKF